MPYIKKYAYLLSTHPTSSPSMFSSPDISNSSHSPHPSRPFFPPLCSFSSYILFLLSYFVFLYYRRFHNLFTLFHFTFLTAFIYLQSLFVLFTFQLVVYACGSTEHRRFNVERNTTYVFMDFRHLCRMNMNTKMHDFHVCVVSALKA